MKSFILASMALLANSANAASDWNRMLLEHARPMPGSNALPKFLLERQLDEANMFSFDVTSYSLKYARCQMIEMYNDQMAGNAGENDNKDGENQYTTILQKQRFAVFRLCPTSSCSSKSQFGCSSSYGEYLVDLSTYMQVMQQFNEEKKESYCNYCEECAKGNNRNLQEEGEGEGEGDREGEGEGEREGEGEGEQGEQGQGEDNNNDQDDQVSYCQDSACSNYSSTCEEQEQDQYNVAINYDDYLGCVEVEAQGVYDSYGNAVNLYVGPHCSSNNVGIKLDLFYDNLCTEYAGGKHNLNTVTGMSFSSSGLADYYQGECLSCKESDHSYENNYNDNQDADDISELCGNLISQAAKCEEKITSTSSSGYSAQQEANISCNYISNVMKGAYNEKGEIYLNLKAYKSQEGYHVNPDAKVTGAQSFWLTFFILGTVGLAAYGAMLHKQLTGGEKASSLYQGGSMA